MVQAEYHDLKTRRGKTSMHALCAIAALYVNRQEMSISEISCDLNDPQTICMRSWLVMAYSPRGSFNVDRDPKL